MKPTISMLIVLTLLSSFMFTPDVLQAQPSAANQVITLQVLEFNKISIISPVMVLATLEESSLHGGGLEAEAIARLIWTSNGEEQKITVACLHGLPGLHLRIDVKEWTGSREVLRTSILLTDARNYDLLRGLSRSAGGCELRYSLHADESVGGKDQVVVYTVTSG